MNFSKSQAWWTGLYKKRIDKTGQMVSSQFSKVGVKLGNYVDGAK